MEKSTNWTGAGIIYNKAYRNYFAQIFLLVAVVGGGWYLVDNTLANIAARHIRTGYGFLTSPSTVPIGESLIPYVDGENSYGTALLVGTINTITLSVLGIILCGIIGLVVGIARLSKNILVNKTATLYIESLRNVPLVLQLLVWYSFITISLPEPSAAMSIADWVFLDNRGFRFPLLKINSAFLGLYLGVVAAVAVIFALRRWSQQQLMRNGNEINILYISLAILILLPLSGLGLMDFLAGINAEQSNLVIDWPRLHDNDYVGGGNLTPEFTAMLLGLSVYTSVFVAEAVRAGILSVAHGQVEAARALGLPAARIMRLVVLPQALRVIIPPTLNQFLNLVKNSSLAVVIGYPELVSVTNSTLNHTGQAIECISVMMAIYLVISLSVSALLNWFNRRNNLVVR